MDKMLQNYDEIENNLHVVCGYDGITYNYKMADSSKQVCKHYILPK